MQPVGEVASVGKYQTTDSPSPKRMDKRKGDRHKKTWKERGLKDHRKGDRHKNRPLKADQPFVGWDGEGIGDKLILLANSQGRRLKSIHGLDTVKCLDWLTKNSKPGQINCWYYFSYDVNMILGDLPYAKVKELYDTNRCFYGDYSIFYLPKRQFRVLNTVTKASFNSYDSFSFFSRSFIAALEEWEIEVPQIIHEGKAARGDFSKWPMEQIVAYNDEECKLLVILLEELRDRIKAADWGLSQWWGPSALAGWFLREHKVHQYLTDVLDLPVLQAYFGGRIDAAGWGEARKVYHYDITSAYPAAMLELPDLTKLTWGKGKHIEEFCLVCVEWEVKETLWGPFPWRDRDGRIFYPPKGKGWYWGIEVLAAQQRLGKRLKLKVSQIISPSGEFVYPLRFPIQAHFDARMAFKKEGNPAEYPIKIGLNSIYGKLAQRKGYKGQEPRFRNYAWAGYITALTRAKLQLQITEETLMVMTDGLWSREPIQAKLEPHKLGGWGGGDQETLLVLQPGVYQYGEEIFSRGFEHTHFTDLSGFLQRFWRPHRELSIPLEVTRFVGMGAALMGGTAWNKWRHFITSTRELSHPLSPSMMGGKRFNGGGLERKGDCEPHTWETLEPQPLWREPDHQGLSFPYVPENIEPKSFEDALDEDLQEELL